MLEKYFRVLENQFDIEKLQYEVADIISKVKIDASNQISLVHRKGYEKERWFDGAGSSFSFDKQRTPIRDNDGNIVRRFEEEEFRFLNRELEGTELSRVYSELGKDYKISRYRIAILNPKTCYGWHIDEEIRIHVPVFTAPGCFLITEDGVATHLPAKGSAYLFHSNNGHHTAMNSDYAIQRMHLLINII